MVNLSILIITNDILFLECQVTKVRCTTQEAGSTTSQTHLVYRIKLVSKSYFCLIHVNEKENVDGGRTGGGDGRSLNMRCEMIRKSSPSFKSTSKTRGA